MFILREGKVMIRKLLCWMGWHQYGHVTSKYIGSFAYKGREGPLFEDIRRCRYCVFEQAWNPTSGTVLGVRQRMEYLEDQKRRYPELYAAVEKKVNEAIKKGL